LIDLELKIIAAGRYMYDAAAVMLIDLYHAIKQGKHNTILNLLEYLIMYEYDQMVDIPFPYLDGVELWARDYCGCQIGYAQLPKRVLATVGSDKKITINEVLPPVVKGKMAVHECLHVLLGHFIRPEAFWIKDIESEIISSIVFYLFGYDICYVGALYITSNCTMALAEGVSFSRLSVLLENILDSCVSVVPKVLSNLKTSMMLALKRKGVPIV